MRDHRPDLRRRPYNTYPDRSQEACVWTTREKQRVPLAMLEDGHLRNVIAFLRRRAPYAKAAALMSVMHGQAVVNGEMALDALEHEERALDEMSIEEFLVGNCVQYANLLHEARRRGLVLHDWNEQQAFELETALVLGHFVPRKEGA